jgi:hypothetical protein
MPVTTGAGDAEAAVDAGPSSSEATMSALLSPPALPLLRHRRTALAAGSLPPRWPSPAAPRQAPPRAVPRPGAEAAADGVVAQDRAALAPGEAVQGSGTGGKALPALPGVVTGPSVIVMASLTVRTPDVPAATAAARGAVAAAGGTITSSVSSSGEPGACDPQPMADGGSASAGTTSAGTTSDSVAGCPPGLAAGTVMTLRVPPARLDALTADLSRLGDVVSASTSSTDVAAEVADVDARVATARASLARVRALMERATTIADIVALDGALAQRQGDLEALEARQRVLADRDRPGHAHPHRGAGAGGAGRRQRLPRGPAVGLGRLRDGVGGAAHRARGEPAVRAAGPGGGGPGVGGAAPGGPS